MSSEERPTVTIYDASTGEVETRPMTDEEFDQWLIDREEETFQSAENTE